jgi:1-acyl-sn-glycerol-3-phosphate acyltransferase
MFGLATGKKILQVNYQIARFGTLGLYNYLVNSTDDVRMRQKALQLTSENSLRLLNRLNVQINHEQPRENLFDRNYFMVCNHMSYLDILILSSLRPAVFVTSVEMEKTFFLGDIAKWGGSFFVDRVNRRNIKKEVEALVRLLKESFNVFIFPEGTSTDGSEILPFKKSLFRVPFMTQFPILPICLKYTHINGEPFSPENCDRVCWYGDMAFAPHFLQLLALQELKVEVKYLEPLHPKDFANHGDLAQAARKSIVLAYKTLH